MAEARSRPATQGKWVLNEKGILARAGLEQVDAVLAGIVDPSHLAFAVKSTRQLLNLFAPPPGLPPDAIVRR